MEIALSNSLILAIVIMVLPLFAIPPTVFFRKKMDPAVWIVLLAVELSALFGGGLFVLTLGFFFR